MRRPVVTIIAALTLAALSVPAITADQILIPAGSAWRYNDTGTDLGTAWRATAFNDTAWASGNAQLGYGDGDESTLISYGSSTTNRRITYYFRKQFNVATPGAVAALNLRYVRDDGAVIYLNGTEIVRSNMPTGTIAYATTATTAIGNADESAWQLAPVDPSLLIAGTNVIAVEIHQQSPTSSDVSFDLELTATEAQAARRPSPCCRLPTGELDELDECHVHGRRHRGRGSLQRHVVCRRAAAIGGLQRADTGGGRADHRRHAEYPNGASASRERGRPDASRPRPPEVPDAHRQRRRVRFRPARSSPPPYCS